MNTLKSLLIIIIVLSASEVFAGYDKLTNKNYEDSKTEKAVVIYGVNWGRQWGCAGFDNAQLQNLTFSRIDSASGNLDGEDIVLNTPAKLFSKNVSVSYAIIVSPGEYALIGFDIKIAKSLSNVSHIKAKNKDLFESGKPAGGSFKVNAGEIVYIGDFGLDCVGDGPIPWRYYIQKEDFESCVAHFKKEYKFIADKQVIYRLFQTNKFGQ
ncbi:MAG: hypothetical protein Q8N85_05195 [Candidatus Omnitrophota bacterium]|nr:hypothetical protein [Candidatus Omnitrophota bacterium]